MFRATSRGPVGTPRPRWVERFPGRASIVSRHARMSPPPSPSVSPRPLRGWAAFVYPALRGSPLVDLWLRRVGLHDHVPLPSRPARLAPSLPHRFVAVVPWGPDGTEARAFRQGCLDAAHAGWQRPAAKVRERVGPNFGRLDRDWAQRWDEQIESALDFRAVVAPANELDEQRLARLTGATDFASGWPESQRIRDLALVIPDVHQPNYAQDSAGRWQVQMETVARLPAAARRVRHVPRTAESGNGPSPAKCTLFGSWEQMGPAESSASRVFWQKAVEQVAVARVRLRPRERLCAVALTKRFAGPALIASELAGTRSETNSPCPRISGSESVAPGAATKDRTASRKSRPGRDGRPHTTPSSPWTATKSGAGSPDRRRRRYAVCCIRSCVLTSKGSAVTVQRKAFPRAGPSDRRCTERSAPLCPRSRSSRSRPACFARASALGLDVAAKEAGHRGRLDMALRFNGNVYLFEFQGGGVGAVGRRDGPTGGPALRGQVPRPGRTHPPDSGRIQPQGAQPDVVRGGACMSPTVAAARS